MCSHRVMRQMLGGNLLIARVLSQLWFRIALNIYICRGIWTYIIIMIISAVAHCSSHNYVPYVPYASSHHAMTDISKMSMAFFVFRSSHFHIPKSNPIRNSSWNWAWRAQVIKLASSMNCPHSSESLRSWQGQWPLGHLATLFSVEVRFIFRQRIYMCNFHVTRDRVIILFAGLMNTCKMGLAWY